LQSISLDVETNYIRLSRSNNLERNRPTLSGKERLELGHIQQRSFLRSHYHIAGLQPGAFSLAAFGDF
jgi:hypothetical protein